jgi:hypothetical protein
MIILERVQIYRIEYYHPHPPNMGMLTFHCAAHSIEEAIEELCVSQNVNRSVVNERAIISKLNCITTALLDELISKHLTDYQKRAELKRKQMAEYLEKHPQKPSNVSKVADNYSIFSVLD